MPERLDDPDPKRRRLTVTIGEPSTSQNRVSQANPLLPANTNDPTNPNNNTAPAHRLKSITNGAHHASSSTTTECTILGNYAASETFPKIRIFPRPTSAQGAHASIQPPDPDPASNPLHHLADLALSQAPPPLRPSPLPMGLQSNTSHHLASYRPPNYQPPTHPPKYPTYFDLCRLRNSTGPLPGTDQSTAELPALRRDVARAKQDIGELERKAGVIAGRNKRMEWRTTMVNALAGVVRARIDAMGGVRERGRWWVNADRKGEMWEEAEVGGGSFRWEVEGKVEGKADQGMLHGGDRSVRKKLKMDESEAAGERLDAQ